MFIHVCVLCVTGHSAECVRWFGTSNGCVRDVQVVHARRSPRGKYGGHRSNNGRETGKKGPRARTREVSNGGVRVSTRGLHGDDDTHDGRCVAARH